MDNRDNDKKRPEDVVRDGQYKVSFWRNQRQDRDYISGKIAKTYTDKDGNTRDSQSFSVKDMLPLSRLCEVAYERGRELEQELYQEQSRDQSQGKAQDYQPQRHESADNSMRDNARDERRSSYRTRRQGNGAERQPRQSRDMRGH